jgi:hypothetical protein
MTLILSGTNGLSDVDGDASTPAIRGTDANTGIFFGTDIIGFSEGGTECGRFNSSGNLQTIGTISVGNATPSTSGAGITFPATQSASSDANTLDDYEEGTFTPTISGSTSAGTGTYSFQVGRYTKIGKRVFVDIYVDWVAHTGTGNLRITNLPFTSVNASSYYAGASIGWTNRLTLTANNYVFGYVSFNTTLIALEQYPVGGTAVTDVSMDTNAAIIISVNYETSA